MKLFAPDGTLIVSTKEVIPGTCDISYDNPVSRNADGTFSFEYTGGTDVDWDGQKTVTRLRQRVFIDEAGDEWLEDQLVLREDEAEDEEEEAA
jgi:hypothetical protein